MDDSFQYLWSDVLEQWHNQYSATELDVHELYQFVLDRFKFEYGSDAFSETENSSDKDKIETAVKQDVNLHQKEVSENNTESKDSDMEFVPAKVNGTKADAEDEPKEAEPITLEQTSKNCFLLFVNC